MKKNIAILLIFLILTACNNSSSSVTVGKCNLEFINGVGDNDGKIFSGSCNVKTNDSTTIKTLTLQKGKIIKEIKYYLSNGNIEYIGNLKDGEIDGYFESYYENGNLASTGKLKVGYREGTWKYYNLKGELEKKIIYKDGKSTNTINY